MKFTIEERILLFSLLPTETSYEILKETLEARKNITFNEEEVRKYDIYSGFYTEVKCDRCHILFDNTGGAVPSALDGKYECPRCKKNDETVVTKEDRGKSQVVFNRQVAEGYTKEIKIKSALKSHLAEKLENFSKENKLTEQYIGLYEKFVV
jgi:phage FluMu protein Com